MARILIISSTHLSRSPRTLKEATTLGHAGHQVEVLTVSNHPPAEAFDRPLLAGAPFRRTALDLLSPAARPAAWAWRLHTRLAREALRLTRRESPWTLGPAAPLLRLARARPADLTIVHNELPAWIGVRLLAEGRTVAADLEDWYSEDLLPSARAVRPLRLLREVEAALLRSAAYVTTPSAALAAALAARYQARPPLVLTNSSALQPAPSRAGAAGRTPRLVWFSQTVGPGRGLEEFLDLWRHSRYPSELTLIGAVAPDYRARLRAAVPAALQPRLSFRDFVAPAQLPALLAEQDVGLALEPATPPNKDFTVSNKILQYLNAGLAVLATPTAGHREVLATAPDAGAFVDLGRPAAGGAALDDFLADAGRLVVRQHAARAAAERCYCWEQEAPKLLAAVDAALAAGTPPFHPPCPAS